jgi:hypothetical protein
VVRLGLHAEIWFMPEADLLGEENNIPAGK